MYGNPIETPHNQKEPVSCIEVTKIGRKLISFRNFVRIASLCVDFLPGTARDYCIRLDFWPNLSFPLEHEIKLVLISSTTTVVNVCRLNFYFMYVLQGT